MVSLIQMKVVCELYQQDYTRVDDHENPERKDLLPEEIPIGGPCMVRSPEGKLFQVFADGSVVPYE